MALYSEGATDNRFLPLVAQRTAENLLLQRASQVIDVLPVQIVRDIREQSRAEGILQAARQSWGYHLLLVHSDADDRSPQAALTERIQPGVALVAQQPEDADLCRELVPIVPVTMTEAWMLADGERLGELLNPALSLNALNIPTSPDEIERIADPKERLSQIARAAYAQRPRRRRGHSIGELYEPLGQQLSLDALGRLSAYQSFQAELATVLARLNYLH